MMDFEKLGLFYLGRRYDLAAGQATGELLLYDSKDLTTHAVCVGMTGSGKTGLCLSLLEEAAIDGVPAIAIDPKGDLGNLLLTFPNLSPDDFRPWIDPADASRENLEVDELAERTARRWREGLAASGQEGRIELLKNSADVAIYTPGSDAGLSLGLLRSFAAPRGDMKRDAEAVQERISAAVSGLLGLVQVEADPLRSREHILLSTILDRAWSEDRDVDMESLIRGIQKPPFDQVGVMDLESFFPGGERFQLAMRLNNLLASPGYSAWTRGEPLEIARLLHTPEGRPRISILSLAHLSEAQRMFFVTLLLGEVIAWMRRQSGASSLRAILYMDEVFGFFPPSANPPSKTPMLTLLKQARAYGLGVVLATQNPVDLDYKGLSNAGTWFLGRLQTERDKLRVLEGLEGVSAASGQRLDRAALDATLSGLKSRVFLMNNVHDDAPSVFETRWALSYLRGPITLEQIRQLMRDRRPAAEAAPAASSSADARSKPADEAATSTPPRGADARPVLPPGIEEGFLPAAARESGGGTYRPRVLATAKVHFVQAAASVDVTQEVWLLAPPHEVPSATWDGAERHEGEPPGCAAAPAADIGFEPLPPYLSRPKTYALLAAALKDYLYRTHRLTLWKCPLTKLVSRVGETEGEFRVRRDLALREARDAEIERLRVRHARALAGLEEKLRRADERIERETAQASQSAWDAVVTAGSSILGGLFGRKRISTTNVGRAASAARAAGRAARQRSDVGLAQSAKERALEQLAEKRGEIEAAAHEIQGKYDPAAVPLSQVLVRPRKSDITVTGLVLAWESA